MDGFWLSLAVLAVLLYVLLTQHLGLRRVRQLADLEPATGADLPLVSIVFSALDEAATLEPALRSLLAVDYPRLEIVAVDDRSTDGTGAILDRIAAQDPRLKVLHVRELPPGWLGKCHALHLAGQAAGGAYILFTDADVHLAPAALRSAIGYCERHRLDHLVVLAELPAREPLLAALLLNFFSFMFSASPPWKVRTAREVYIGMGAFNLVRAAAYRAAGGHETLRLEVIDDILLGQRMKAAGFRQDVLLGRGSVLVEWYASTADLVRGLEKNSYAAVEYNAWRLLAATAAVVLARYWPVAGLFVTSGATFWINVGSLAAAFLIHLDILGLTRWSARCLWWWLPAPLVMLWILWRGVLLTLRRRGIVWRGTLYPLDELVRAHRSHG
jgi:glycosyltransferase involved in cell wall biosynthesis